MELNPYQSPQSTPRARTGSALIAVVWIVVAIPVALELLISGVYTTFVWGIGLGLHFQVVYGVVAIAAGICTLERLARYVAGVFGRSLKATHRTRGVIAQVLVFLIWAVIVIGLVLEVAGVVEVFIWRSIGNEEMKTRGVLAR